MRLDDYVVTLLLALKKVDNEFGYGFEPGNVQHLRNKSTLIMGILTVSLPLHLTAKYFLNDTFTFTFLKARRLSSVNLEVLRAII